MSGICTKNKKDACTWKISRSSASERSWYSVQVTILPSNTLRCFSARMFFALLVGTLGLSQYHHFSPVSLPEISEIVNETRVPTHGFLSELDREKGKRGQICERHNAPKI
jgi:hypothetical protein